jgi:hypothetical protein
LTNLARYRAPAEYKETNVDVEIDRRGPRDSIDVEYDRRQTYDKRLQDQLDITEQDYRRRTDETYDVEYERRRPSNEVDVDVKVDKTYKRDMGYYDDEGQYHSFRRGVERAADRIFHPFHHHHHHHDDKRTTEVVVDESAGPSRVRGGSVEQVRFVEPRRGYSGFNTVTIPCHFIRIGDLVILQGRPCEVIRISMSSQTGQYRYLGVDLFTKKLQEESSFNTNPEPSVYVQSMLGPVFKQYRILDIRNDGRVVCMTETGDVKQALQVIDNNGLFDKIERSFADGRGSVRALVINDGGRELIVDYKVIHGSRL